MHFLIPGDPDTISGGYCYDRRMVAELQALGWQVSVHRLDAGFPEPSRAALEHAAGVLGAIAPHSVVLIDGLAFGAMPEVVQAHAQRLHLLALIHMPLAAEPGREPQRAQRRRHRERLALQSARHIIATGPTTASMLEAEPGLAGRLSVIEPGTDERPLSRRERHEPAKLLCVGAITYGKGQDLLIDALRPLAPIPWQLCCVGSLTRSPDSAAALRARLQGTPLAARVTLAGELRAEDLPARFADADLFVLATRFESYCMAVAEAIAHGLPVVSTLTGAIADLVGARAGLLVPVDDVDALRAALRRALTEPALLAGLANGAAARRPLLPRWSQAAGKMAALLTRFDALGTAGSFTALTGAVPER